MQRLFLGDDEVPISILAFSSYYLPGYKGGGPIKTLKNLFDKAGLDLSFRLIAGDRDLGDDIRYTQVCYGDWNRLGNESVFYLEGGLKGLRQVISLMRKTDYDIVYLNSFFSFRYSIFPLLISKVLGRKVLLGPRGEFSMGALALKRRKKLFFIRLYKVLGLHRGVVFQASSQYEEEDIRNVLGDAAEVKIAEDIGAQEFAQQIRRRSNGSLRVVFLSRISPKKNLLAALDILKMVQQPVEYDIYGPIEDHDYWVQCLAAIDALPLNVRVKYKGELHPEQVVRTLSGYDLFFMPTKGENYGHVIAEALCAGLPILIANTTPWRGLQQKGIGWDLSIDAPMQFSAIIDQVALMPVSEYQEIRQKVLAWARNKFSQCDAVEANIALFRHVYKKS